LALVNMSVIEQRHRAALAVLSGVPVVDVAARMGVSSAQRWLARYRVEGLAGLANRSRRPRASPGRLGDEVEAAICELRRGHPRWGRHHIRHELGRKGRPVPARSTVYQGHGLIEPMARRRKRREFRCWERDQPMSLWQVDIVAGILVADDGVTGKLDGMFRPSRGARKPVGD
jgi:transposase